MREYVRQAKQLQALAHPMRFRILEILTLGPACVCDLVELTGKRQPYISQHMAALRSAGLVTTERRGWNIFYRLNYAKLTTLQAMIAGLSQKELDYDEGKMSTVSHPRNICNTIPRDDVTWRSSINAELCNGCQSCVDACPGDVYEWDSALGRPIVARLESCVVFCTDCAKACPEDAITFPNKDEVVEEVKQLRLKYAGQI